jgi:hypothetical protein
MADSLPELETEMLDCTVYATNIIGNLTTKFL